MFSAVEAGEDHSVATFTDEGGGKTLIASRAGAFERVEADGFYAGDAFVEALVHLFNILFRHLFVLSQVGDIFFEIGDAVVDRLAFATEHFFEEILQSNDPYYQKDNDSEQCIQYVAGKIKRHRE